ncbi:hypothetical protein L6R50_09100 [Myxococcota bacterium]|nr:hypothetical protein [Myxococcota bacterium]
MRDRVLACLVVGALAPSWAGCDGETASDDDTAPDPHVEFVVDAWTDPEPPVGGDEVELWFRILDQGGDPVDDLQINHDRMVHTFIISADLTSFQHRHHEDFYDLSADDLREATFHFPLTFPYSGDFLLLFDFAHGNLYYPRPVWFVVDGDTPQLPEPVVDLATERVAGDVRAELTWDGPAIAGYEASWSLHLTEAEGGQEVTDLVQYLGADGHAALVSDDLAFAGHTHAWFPGMENVPPSHEMSHEYDGPDLPFRYAFDAAGVYKMWVQFVRAGAPDEPYLVDFMFEVSP